MPGPPGSRSVEGVQFSEDLRDEVAAGAITVSVRLWRRPKVRVGGRYPVAGVAIEVTAVELVPFSSITSADVRRSGESSREALRTRAAHAGPIHDDALVYRVVDGGLVCALNAGNSPLALPAGEVLLASADLVDGKLPPNAAAWLV